MIEKYYNDWRLQPNPQKSEFSTKRAGKMRTRNNILQSLAGTSWGANANCLRQSAMSLVLPVAEYCAPSWLTSTHRKKVDVQLNNTLRTISGTILSTPLPWLPVLCNITPSDIRRQTAYINTVTVYDNSILNDVMNNLPEIRLTSRKPPWQLNETLSTHNEKHIWRDQWSKADVVNKQLIDDPTEMEELGDPKSFSDKSWKVQRPLKQMGC